MNSKFKKTAIAGVVIGCMMLTGVGAVAWANGNAYQEYKQVVQQTLSAENMTVNSQVSIKQDGRLLMEGGILMQSDGKTCYMSSDWQIGNDSMTMESNLGEKVMVIRMGDHYFISDTANPHSDGEFTPSPSMMKLMEMVADLLVGDVKNYFVSDGDSISVHLEGAQIPELVHVAAAAVMESMKAHPQRMPEGHQPIGAVLEELAIDQAIQVQSVHLNAVIQDGFLQDQVLTVVISGKDEAGTAHEMELVGQFLISEIGTTVAATIDTSGQTVEVMERFHR